MLISKGQIKTITSLHQKKYRQKLGSFIAEGPKIISDLVESGLKLQQVFSTQSLPTANFDVELMSEKELQKISALKTANSMLAVFEIPIREEIEESGLIVALDAIRDPGNLGTIIRLCDWFGISHLVCTEDTADCYNPKVVQASMGSIARVNVHYVALKDYLQKTNLPIFGAFMDGDSVYETILPNVGILVMGNEANGISTEISETIQHRLSIPNFSKNNNAESLNVATATAVLLSEFRRTIGK
ncbi:MAG: RNA methyltransferase [Flavobacteriaceae bacterium]|nr:RNA methyltransferase [Flavobacteriaceae bacterium]